MKSSEKIVIVEKTRKLQEGAIYIPKRMGDGSIVLFNLSDMEFTDKMYSNLNEVKQEFANEDKWFIGNTDLAWTCRFNVIANGTV